jgi:hypothetical protein
MLNFSPVIFITSVGESTRDFSVESAENRRLAVRENRCGRMRLDRRLLQMCPELAELIRGEFHFIADESFDWVNEYFVLTGYSPRFEALSLGATPPLYQGTCSTEPELHVIGFFRQ